LLEHLCTVLAGVVVLTAAVVAIIVDQVAVVSGLSEPLLVETQLLPVTLLVSQIGIAALAGELLLALALETVPILPPAVELVVSLTLELLLLCSCVLLVTAVLALPIAIAAAPTLLFPGRSALLLGLLLLLSTLRLELTLLFGASLLSLLLIRPGLTLVVLLLAASLLVLILLILLLTLELGLPLGFLPLEDLFLQLLLPLAVRLLLLLDPLLLSLLLLGTLLFGLLPPCILLCPLLVAAFLILQADLLALILIRLLLLLLLIVTAASPTTPLSVGIRAHAQKQRKPNHRRKREAFEIFIVHNSPIPCELSLMPHRHEFPRLVRAINVPKCEPLKISGLVNFDRRDNIPFKSCRQTFCYAGQ
jgi:hypothetical protein